MSSPKKNNKKQKAFRAETDEDDKTTENEFSDDPSQKITDELRQRNLSPTQQKPTEIESKLTQFKKAPMERSMPVVIQHSNVYVRTVWTLIMLGGFVLIISFGHFYCTLLIIAITIGIFKQILSLKRNLEKQADIPWFNVINWYFFSVAIYFFYGRILEDKLSILASKYELVSYLVKFHFIISFMLYCFGFLMFVISLKKGYYRYQFRQFGWAHLTILFVVAQTSVITLNLYEGIIWFITPVILVITNDIFAYVFGSIWGKTKLIELSPKKTWQGFLGGAWSSFFIAYFLGLLLSRYQPLICRQENFTYHLWDFPSCEPHDIYIQEMVPIPYTPFTIPCSDFQIHSMFMSVFASVIAPFGGFFASGFKRAIKIKDFADVIPGHGGLTDRMDCQLLMGMFSYLYLHQIVLKPLEGVDLVLKSLSKLNSQEQLLVFQSLQNILQFQNLLPN